jgi:hypothetical protein
VAADATSSPPHIPTSAYEVVRSSAQEANVGAYLAAHPGATLWRDIKATAQVWWNVPEDAKITAQINYPDGSSNVMYFDYVSKDWRHLKGSARDSSNNTIPEGRKDFPGPSGRNEYTFRGWNHENDLIEFLYHTTLHGIPIEGTVGGGGRGIACVEAAGNVRCHAF